MKKSIIITVLLIFCLSFQTVYADTYAKNNPESTIIEVFEDGSWLEVTWSDGDCNRASQSITKNKTLTYKNSSGEALWAVTLTGKFTYESGVSSTCTSASISTQIYNDNWKITEKSASKSGNQAIGNVTGKKYTLGIATQTIEREITITCDKYGNCF